MGRGSLAEFFEDYSRRGKEIAVAYRRGYRTTRWSYGRIAEVANQFARELEARGVARGDRILLWGENSAEWIAAFWGGLLRGAVLVPMDPIATPDFAGRVAQQVEVKLGIGSRAAQRWPGGIPAIALEDLPEAAARHSVEPYPPASATRADTLEIVFTSGTTAEPRGVVLSHGNILANIEPLELEIQKYLRYERWFHPLRFLNLLPLSHVFGQLLGIFIPPLLGATTVFLDSMGPGEIIRGIKRERVSVLISVPRAIESLEGKIERDLEAANRLERFEKQLSASENAHFLRRWWRFRRIRRQFGWRFVALISGGAALPEGVENFWSGLGYAVIQGYGLTETTSLVSVNHPFRLSRGSIGKALPGLEIRLGDNGEILVRGENVAAGYWQGRQLEPVAGEDGWFHTGDLGGLDAEGNLYFKGRQKNVIVTPAGMNVYPEDLEAALRKQAGVRDCAVVGLERSGNAEPCAVLLLEEPGADPRPIVERANRALAEYQQMRHWVVWPELDFPRTPTQKPMLPRIRSAVEAQLAASTSNASTSPLAEFLARVTHHRLSEFSADANLETDLKLSSLDRVELLSALEDRFQIDLSETRFAEAVTVGELERLLSKPPGRAANYVYPRWAQHWPITWLRLAVYYLLAGPTTYLLARPRAFGRSNLRDVRGPALVISNHVTYVDIGCVLAGLPAHLRHRVATAMDGERLNGMRRPAAGMNVFKRALNRMNYFLVVALFNVFPLPRTSGFRESFSFAGELVDRGWSVLVFPEGERTKDGKLAPFRAGIGLLAERLFLPVIPMRIDGLFELKQAGRKIARPGEVKVWIGAPVQFSPESKPEEITRELERRVASLGPAYTLL